LKGCHGSGKTTFAEKLMQFFSLWGLTSECISFDNPFYTKMKTFDIFMSLREEVATKSKKENVQVLILDTCGDVKTLNILDILPRRKGIPGAREILYFWPNLHLTKEGKIDRRLIYGYLCWSTRNILRPSVKSHPKKYTVKPEKKSVYGRDWGYAELAREAEELRKKRPIKSHHEKKREAWQQMLSTNENRATELLHEFFDIKIRAHTPEWPFCDCRSCMVLRRAQHKTANRERENHHLLPYFTSFHEKNSVLQELQRVGQKYEQLLEENFSFYDQCTYLLRQFH
jgi:hypothetical protein